MPCELDPKMPKATNALHGDQISTAQAGVAKSVVSRNARAEERSGFYGRELIRNGSDAACFSDHHFRISSIHGHSQCHGVLTIHNVSASARFAHSVFSGNQANTNPLTDFPPGHTCTQRFNATHHFMPRNARQTQTRVAARDRGGIGVTDSACFHSNPNLSCSKAQRLAVRPREECPAHILLLLYMCLSREPPLFISPLSAVDSIEALLIELGSVLFLVCSPSIRRHPGQR